MKTFCNLQRIANDQGGGSFKIHGLARQYGRAVGRKTSRPILKNFVPGTLFICGAVRSWRALGPSCLPCLTNDEQTERTHAMLLPA